MSPGASNKPPMAPEIRVALDRLPILPFNGSPPSNGWVFSGTSSERDTFTLVNIMPDTFTYNSPTVWTRIYPFPPNVIPFNDISPRFTNDAILFCNSEDTVNYIPGIIDPDGDSINVSFYPLIAGGAGVVRDGLRLDVLLEGLVNVLQVLDLNGKVIEHLHTVDDRLAVLALDLRTRLSSIYRIQDVLEWGHLQGLLHLIKHHIQILLGILLNRYINRLVLPVLE